MALRGGAPGGSCVFLQEEGPELCVTGGLGEKLPSARRGRSPCQDSKRPAPCTWASRAAELAGTRLRCARPPPLLFGRGWGSFPKAPGTRGTQRHRGRGALRARARACLPRRPRRPCSGGWLTAASTTSCSSESPPCQGEFPSAWSFPCPNAKHRRAVRTAGDGASENRKGPSKRQMNSRRGCGGRLSRGQAGTERETGPQGPGGGQVAPTPSARLSLNSEVSTSGLCTEAVGSLPARPRPPP